MNPPEGYFFRAPTWGDLDAVADVLAADDLADCGQVVLDANFVRTRWTRSDFDLATDGSVAMDDDETIVAYGQVMPEEPDLVESWGIVHPAHRGRGLGSALLDRIEDRSAKLLADHPSPRFRHVIGANDDAAAAMLRTRGFRPVRHFWHMGIDLDGPIEPGPSPEGIEIDGITSPDDLPAVHAVLQEAFAGDWGYHPEPFDSWAEEAKGSPNHDPTLWLVARDDGQAVGALTAEVFGERGWIGELGVLPSHRGRGIGAALLRRSLGELERRGLPHAILNVDAENPTGATALYERVGMRIVRRWDLWERSSGPASGGGRTR